MGTKFHSREHIGINCAGSGVFALKCGRLPACLNPKTLLVMHRPRAPYMGRSRIVADGALHGVFGVKISIIFYIGQAQSMRAVESFPSIYDTEVLLLVLLLHASTRSQRQGRRAVWFPKKWLSKNAGRTLRRKLFASQNPGIKSRPPRCRPPRGGGCVRI